MLEAHATYAFLRRAADNFALCLGEHEDPTRDVSAADGKLQPHREMHVHGCPTAGLAAR